MAHAAPWLDVAGRELVRLAQSEVGLDAPLRFVVVRNDELMLAEETQRFCSAVDYDDGVVRLLRPSAVTPEVRMDPERSFGQPAVPSLRTDVLAEDLRAGSTREELADLYELPAEQVDQALRFELIRSRELVA